MLKQFQLSVQTRGRGSHEITREVQQRIAESGLRNGLCHVFVHHTSASLMLCENADPSVRSDLETFFARLVPDGDPMFRHDAEGPDDMPAHIRAILTNMDLTLPLANGRADLGTWQGIYLWEHRTHAHQRRITLSLHGE